jgi:hypothetical protein
MAPSPELSTVPHTEEHGVEEASNLGEPDLEGPPITANDGRWDHHIHKSLLEELIKSSRPAATIHGSEDTNDQWLNLCPELRRNHGRIVAAIREQSERYGTQLNGFRN